MRPASGFIRAHKPFYLTWLCRKVKLYFPIFTRKGLRVSAALCKRNKMAGRLENTGAVKPHPFLWENFLIWRPVWKRSKIPSCLKFPGPKSAFGMRNEVQLYTRKSVAGILSSSFSASKSLWLHLYDCMASRHGGDRENRILICARLWPETKNMWYEFQLHQAEETRGETVPIYCDVFP